MYESFEYFEENVMQANIKVEHKVKLILTDFRFWF